MERISRSPGDGSLGRHGIRLIIGGEAGVVGVAGSPWDGGLGRHGI